MGQKFRVEATSDTPPAKAEWAVDLGDDPQQVLIYTNLGYDLIAAAMMKLGVEYSKYILDNDADRLNAEIKRVQETLLAGTAAG